MTAYLLYPIGPTLPELGSPVAAAGLGVLAGIVIIILDRLIELIRKRPTVLNSSAQMLRRH